MDKLQVVWCFFLKFKFLHRFFLCGIFRQLVVVFRKDVTAGRSLWKSQFEHQNKKNQNIQITGERANIKCDIIHSKQSILFHMQNLFESVMPFFNPLSAIPAEWPNKRKQFGGWCRYLSTKISFKKTLPNILNLVNKYSRHYLFTRLYWLPLGYK